MIIHFDNSFCYFLNKTYVVGAVGILCKVGLCTYVHVCFFFFFFFFFFLAVLFGK